MKHLFTLFTVTACALVLLAATAATAATVVYEGFDVNGAYTSGSTVNGLSGGDNFSGAWNDSGVDFFTWSGSMTYGGLINTDGRLINQQTDTYDSANRVFNSSGVDGDIYYSFLYQNGAGDNSNDRLLSVDQATPGQERYRLINDGSGNVSLMVKTVGGSGSHEIIGTTSSIDVHSSPVLVVGHIAVNTASDGITVYFNPTDLSDVAGTAAESLSVTEAAFPNGGSFSTVGSFFIGSTNRSNMWDEIRLSYGVDSAMSDVLPVVPEPALAVCALLGILLVRKIR